ncbi:MAG: hypothetical protein ACW96M_01250 [Candidatus Thorarchaeota archaeon]|jgi:hypothetical protein
MNDMKSSMSSSLMAQIVLWGATLLAPSLVLVGYTLNFVMAPIWSVPFPFPFDFYYFFVNDVWFIYAVPAIVTAAVLSLYIRGFGTPVVTKLTIALGAIIVISIAIVSDYSYFVAWPLGYEFVVYIPLPIAFTIQYIIFQSFQKV